MKRNTKIALACVAVVAVAGVAISRMNAYSPYIPVNVKVFNNSHASSIAFSNLKATSDGTTRIIQPKNGATIARGKSATVKVLLKNSITAPGKVSGTIGNCNFGISLVGGRFKTSAYPGVGFACHVTSTYDIAVTSAG